MTIQPATYTQYRTFDHVYLFKTKGNQSLTLKIFNQAKEKLLKVAASHLAEKSGMDSATTLLNLFVQNKPISSLTPI